VSAIQVGDLVMMVRCCCERSGLRLGEIAVAKSIYAYGTKKCKGCGWRAEGSVFIVDFPKDNGLPASWLKRIPPLDELERDQIVKELSL
jgi:hypothetical protein